MVVLRDTFDTAKEVTKLVKDSPKAEATLNQLKEENESIECGVHTFCPTRWTVRGSTLQSIEKNRNELIQLFERIESDSKDSSRRSKARGMKADMMKFDYFFGSTLAQSILSLTDKLSKCLQNPALSASEAQETAREVLNKLQEDRNNFNQLWEQIRQSMVLQGIGEPVAPRKRKHRQPHGEEGGEEFQPETTEQRYRIHYITAYDHVIQQIIRRFDQPDYKVYGAMEAVLLDGMAKIPIKEHLKKEFKCACKSPCQCQAVSIESLYETEINFDSLQNQFEVFNCVTNPQRFENKQPTEFSHCLKDVQTLSKSQKTMYQDIITLIKLIMLAPASNANSERVFSSLRRIKTYLRSTMNQERLENLMVLTVHKEILDNLEIVQAAETFTKASVRRIRNFGTFLPK